MNRLEKIKNNFVKALDIIGKVFSDFFRGLIESYGWRGFFFRVIFVIIFFNLSVAGIPEYNNGPSGGKLLVISGLLLIYAVGKLIYDYTKVGKETEAKKRGRSG